MGRKSGVDDSIPLLYILGPAYEGYFGEAALRTPRRVHKGDHALLTSLSRRQRQDVATKALMSSVAPAASVKDSVRARGHRTAGPSRTMTHGVHRQSPDVLTPAVGRARTHDVNMRFCEHIKPRTPLALHGGARGNLLVDPQASIGRPAADPHERRTAPTVEHESGSRQEISSKAGGLTRLPAAGTLKSWAPPPQPVWLTPSCMSVERSTRAKAVSPAAFGELHQPNNEELKKLKVIEIPCPRRDARGADMDGASLLDSLSSLHTEASSHRVKRSPYPPSPAFLLQEWRGGGFLLKIRRETHTRCRPKQGPASSVKGKAGLSVCGSSVSSSTNTVRESERDCASDLRVLSPSSNQAAPSTGWASAVELPAAAGTIKQEDKHKLEIVLCTPPTSAYDATLVQS